MNVKIDFSITLPNVTTMTNSAKTGLFFVLADYGDVYLLQNVKGAFV